MPLPSSYQSFIHASRYSRFQDSLGRRETWEETVERYISYFKKRISTGNKKIPWGELREAILNLEIMPSMRCLMTAGEALDIDQVAGYNCSYLTIDNVKAFDEIFYILMCGTGVGFSVESRYTNKLPEVPDELHPTETTIIFKDSRIGWASGFREFLSLLYSGKIPNWDVSRLRPAGARLKTFGGRSSGPEPLVDLLKYTVQLFNKARGRKFTTLECHDLVCKIADVVVSGGVRRSALISLSDLNDDHLRLAKSGEWWNNNAHRAISNNSAVYEQKPDMGIFMKEWLSLFESHSGERGIFSRKASQIQAARYDRRSAELDYGTNPCCFTGDTLIAVADGRNAISIEQLAKESQGIHKFPVYSAHKSYWKNQHGGDRFRSWSKDVKWAVAKSTGVKPIYEVTLDNGDTFKSTDDHLLATSDGDYVKVCDSIGRELQEFFTSISNNYRCINAFGDGYSRQHRMIWEFFNGPLQEGMVIDHKQSGSLDLIDNLQLMSKEEHDKKTGIERIGANNPIHRANKERFLHNSSVANRMEKNSRFLGLNDLELIEIGKKSLKECGKVDSKICRSLDSRFPLSFSKNRFGGKWKNFVDIVLEKQIYVPPIQKEFMEIPKEKDEWRFLVNKPRVVSVRFIGMQPIYDLQVEDNHNFYIITKTFDELAKRCRGILVHNSEIILRPYQFCNLSEVIVRAEDSLEDLKRKVRLATILGTMQSTLSNFRYLNKRWKANTEEERLLGVSLTGIMDHPLLNGSDLDKVFPKNLDKLQDWLIEMRETAVSTNKEFAKYLNIEESAAITCVKPSGTVSQLTDTSSGIHPRYAQYYIRRVRMDKKDPLADYMINIGFKAEEDFYQKTNWVFSFPIKAPDGAVTRNDRTAIEQLELWKIYAEHYCEHKPSITVYVGDDEWLDVGAWVYKNMNNISGVSFLPRDNGNYRQAPYEEITKEQYETLLRDQLSNVDWTNFKEETDTTTSAKELACSAGVCEL